MKDHSFWSEDGMRRIKEAGSRRMKDPEIQARAAAGREAKLAWSVETQAQVAAWLAAGESLREIGRRLGIHVNTVKFRAARHGLNVDVRSVNPATGLSDIYLVPVAASDVLRQHYSTDMDRDELMRLYVEARGRPCSWRTMWNHAVRLHLKRPPNVYGFKTLAASGTRTQVEQARAERVVIAAKIQEMLDSGLSQTDVRAALKISKSRMQRMRADGMLVIPPREARGRMPRVYKKRVYKPKPRVERPRVPARYAAPQTNDARRVKVLLGRRVAFDEDMGAAIEEWIATNGVKRCPAAAVAATTASISDADSSALNRHHQMIEATKGDPKQRYRAKMWGGF